MNNFTVRDAIHAVRTLKDRTGKLSEVNPWSTRLILHFLIVARSTLLYEKITRQKLPVSKHNIQNSPCIPLELVDPIECPCYAMEGCEFRRTKWEIPAFIGNPISVNSLDGSINYTYVPWDRFKHRLNSRHSPRQRTPYYTFKDVTGGTYLYLYNDVHKESIKLTGIFENPIQVYLMRNCEGETPKCPRPLDFSFHVDPDLRLDMYRLADEMLNKFRGQEYDILANQVEDFTKPPIK